MTKTLFDRAADLLEKIGGATDSTAMEMNAWEALRLAREMRAAHEPEAHNTLAARFKEWLESGESATFPADLSEEILSALNRRGDV